MISLWPHWQRPYFIILLPIVIGLLWQLWRAKQVKGAWREIIPAFFQPWLLKGTSAPVSSIPKILLTLASIFALIALLGPSWKHQTQIPVKADSPLVIVLDLSNNMLAADVSPSRLQAIKYKISDILKARKDAQTALIVYTGSAHVVVPLTDDRAAIENLLPSLNPSIMPASGQSANKGIDKAIEMLVNTQQDKFGQILLATSALSNSEKQQITASLKRHPITLNVMGIGTPQGGPIPTKSGFLKDRQGNIISTHLDTHSLAQFAYGNKGAYSSITLDDADIKQLGLDNINTNHQRALDETAYGKNSNQWQDQGYWFLLPILALAAFSARKNWLFIIPLLFLIQPQPANAYELDQLLLNKNQQAQKLLKDNKPKEAAERFDDPQWKAYANYQAADYKKAEETFSSEQTAEGIYNYGNALARQGKYKEAIEAWDKALELKPDFEQAITNKKIVEDALKQQQQQQQQNDQNNKDNKDDSSDKNDQNNQNGKDDQNSQSDQNDKGDQNNQNNQQGNNNQQNQNQQNNQDQQQNDQQGNNSSQQDQSIDQNQQQQTTGQLASEEDENGEDKNGKKVKVMTAEEIEKAEQDEAMQQLIRTIPDDPSELLRRKFQHEQYYRGRGRY